MPGKLFSIYNKIFLGFAIAIAGIGYFLISSLENSNLSITDSRKIDMELRMMRSAERLLDNMQDIETAYRGYAITGNRSYLHPAKTAMDKTTIDLRELLYSTSFDSTEKKIAQSLSVDVSQKLRYAHEVINLRSANQQKEAFDLISTDNGVRIMNNIRLKIDSLEKIGRAVLNTSNSSKMDRATANKVHFLELTIVVLSFLIVIHLLIGRDVRKQDLSSQELKISEEYIRDLYESAPVGYLSVDASGKIIQINKTALHWLDMDYKQVVGHLFLTDIVRLENPAKNIYELISKNPINLEGMLATQSKASFPVNINATIKIDETGKHTESRIVFTDLRERKKSEERVNYLARLIDNTNDSIISTDQNLIIESWNKGAEKMYGYTSGEAIGKSYPEILRIDASPEVTKQVLDNVIKNGNWTAEVKHYKKDGTLIYVENSVTIFNHRQSGKFQLVTINQDITARKSAERKLKKLNEELISQVEQKTNEITDIFQRISECFISLDKAGHIIYANEYAEKFIGIPKADFLGKKMLSLFTGQNETPIKQRIKEAIESDHYTEFEEKTFLSKRWVSVKCYPSANSISIFFLDITEKKNNEIKLIENEKKYRLLFENNPIPMWILDINSRLIIDVNDAAIQNYGYSREEFIGKSAYELRDDDEKKKYSNYIRHNPADNFNVGYWLHKRKDGSSIVVEIMAYTLVYDGHPCRLILSNDVTEKIKFQQEIESSRDQLRQLSGYLEKVREEERTNIAREIHDELGQQLTGLKMDLSWLAKRINTEDAQNMQKVNEMMVLIDDTVKTVRKIASELRPGILDDLGLIAALDWQSKEFEKRTGVICSFNHDFTDRVLDKNMSTGIFRIYQEALTNVARHASATEVKSFLRIGDHDCIEFTIIDNGKGISTDLSPKKTLGLIGMKERALMMHGSLNIDSKEGGGTKINLKVPLEN